MTYYETQQNPQFNPQAWGIFNPSWMLGGGYGLGQAAYGQQFGGQQFGQPGSGAFGSNAAWGAQPQGSGQPQWWGQHGFGQHPRQLSQQDVSEVVRQLLPALPQILAMTQQQPYGGIGYGGYGQGQGSFGGAYGQQRTLTQQDVNEVVRQILPIVPQIVGALQSQPQLQYAALQGGQFPFQQSPFHYGTLQNGAPQFQSAFGAPNFGGQQQRLTPQDVADVARQLLGVIPQVIGNLQAYNQQRMI